MRGQSRPRDKPLGNLPDGTPYYAPLGELPVDADAGLVQCHLCGSWFRQLHHAHLSRHDYTVDDYRETFGLRARHPLQAPDLSELRSRTMSRLLQTDERVRAGVEIGLQMARSGRLYALRVEADASRARRLEAVRLRQATALAMGEARARRLIAEREQRARELGHASLAAYLAAAHAVARRPLADIARELGVSVGTVARDLDRLGIPRIPLDEARTTGRRRWASIHAERRERRLRELGFATLEEYLADRRRSGITQQATAIELGVHVRTLRRLVARFDAAGA